MVEFLTTLRINERIMALESPFLDCKKLTHLINILKLVSPPHVFKWPFPSCFESHYKSEAKCKVYYENKVRK